MFVRLRRALARVARNAGPPIPQPSERYVAGTGAPIGLGPDARTLADQLTGAKLAGAVFVETPTVDAFLREYDALCRRFGYALLHESGDGAFLVDVYDQSSIAWVSCAQVSPGLYELGLV